MKKIRVFMTIVLVILMTGCSTTNTPVDEKIESEIIEGIILEVYDKSFRMLSFDTYGEYQVSYENSSELLMNQSVKVTYDGIVQETYPMGIQASEVTATSTLLTMYINVLDELKDKDSALNTNVNVISFDIEDTIGLTENEKNVLANVMALRYGAEEILFMTYQELCDAGYIDTEKVYFDGGLLISLNGIKEDNSYEFSVAKYKGGLAAYFMSCTANNNGTWSYKVVGEAIS